MPFSTVTSQISIGRSASRAARPGARAATDNRQRPAGSCAVGGLVMEMPGVLYDATLWRREVVKLLARLGVPAKYPAFFDRWDRDYLPDVQRGFRLFEEAFQAFLLATGLSWGQIDEVEAASRIRRQELAEGVRPLPGVAAALGRLSKQGLRLAVLTDSPFPAVRLRAELEKLDLDRHFQALIASLDLEATKPAPECYQAAITALELPAEALVLVACDGKSLAGARACGLRTVAINCPEQSAADVHLTRLSELPDVVDDWSARQGAA